MNVIDNSKIFYNSEIAVKKINALINFSQAVDDFKDWQALTFLTRWMAEEDLDSEGLQFLDHLLEKNKINYLDWCCKFPWVRKQLKAKKKREERFVFEQMRTKMEIIEAKRGLPRMEVKYTIKQLEMF